MANFVWGGAGTRRTPEDIERQRVIAEQLMQQGADFSPVAHWTQGAARVASALNGGLMERRADKASEANDAENAEMMASLTGGGTPEVSPVSAPVDPQSAPDDLVQRVIKQESGGNPNAVSPKGAQGLMQVMPATARDPGFGVKPMDPTKAFDPAENQRFGTEYLNAMKSRYGDDEAALVAYNAGPGVADKYVKTGRNKASLPKETQGYIANILGGSSAPQQTAQAGMNPAVLKAMTSPYASPQVQGIAKMMMQQQLEQNDPKTKLEMEKIKRDLAQPDPSVLAREKFDFEKAQAEKVKPTGDMQEYEFAKSQGFPGTFTEYKQSLKGGMSLRTNEDGTVEFIQGAGAVKPLTESQSKDTVFVTRASGALPTIDQHGEALARFGEGAGGSLPMVGNYLKSEEYQVAERAGKEFLQAILRKDTGAAITKEETTEYGTTYLPVPGDGPKVLADKKAARTRALQAIELGLPPAAILKLERAGIDMVTAGKKEDAPKADKPISEMTDEELEALANGK